MKTFTVIVLLSLSLHLFSQNDRISEENNCINDVFINLVDTSVYYLRDRPYRCWDDNDLGKYAKHPKKYKKNLSYLDSFYSPFEFSKLLIATKGNENLISDFEEKFDLYSDSIAKLPDSSTLMLYAKNELYKISLSDLYYCSGYSKKNNTLYDLVKVDTTLQSRSFDFNTIKNKGKYVISNEDYPSFEVRKKTKNITEIGKISISRISFNESFNKGVFFYDIYKDTLNAEGYIVVVEKTNNVWKITMKSMIWIS